MDIPWLVCVCLKISITAEPRESLTVKTVMAVITIMQPQDGSVMTACLSILTILSLLVVMCALKNTIAMNLFQWRSFVHTDTKI